MIEKNSEGSQKNKISNGLIIKKEHLRSTIFPEEVQNEIISIKNRKYIKR
jgi:hypothetical protein